MGELVDETGEQAEGQQQQRLGSRICPAPPARRPSGPGSQLPRPLRGGAGASGWSQPAPGSGPGPAGRTAHHNPMDPFPRQKAGLFRPRVPRRIPRQIPDTVLAYRLEVSRTGRGRRVIAGRQSGRNPAQVSAGLREIASAGSGSRHEPFELPALRRSPGRTRVSPLRGSRAEGCYQRCRWRSRAASGSGLPCQRRCSAAR